MKRKEAFVVLSILPIVLYFSWLILAASLEAGIGFCECDVVQSASARLLGAVGGEKAQEDMILYLRDKEPGCYDEHTGEAVVRIGRRYPLERNPHLMSLLAEGIIDRKTPDRNRWDLVLVLEEVTGESFGYPAESMGDDRTWRFNIGAARRNVMKWWPEWKMKHQE